MLKVITTNIEGLVILQPQRHHDSRGFFSEIFNEYTAASLGITTRWVQDNLSLSLVKGTLRGFHCQSPPKAQAKLVSCSNGSLFDVAIDVRKTSPTYGQWFGVELSFENGKQMFIPEGFLHGYLTLSDNTQILYKCSNFYSPIHEVVVSPLGGSLGVAWPSVDGLCVAPKDVAGVFFEDFDSPFF